MGKKLQLDELGQLSQSGQYVSFKDIIMLFKDIIIFFRIFIKLLFIQPQL